MSDDFEASTDATEGYADEVETEGADLEATEADSGTPEAEDPWAWAKDLDPSKVEKTWSKFTEEWDSLRRDREQLAPLSKIQEALSSDPGLATVIEDYFNAPSDDPVQEVEKVKQELGSLKFAMATERELASVAAYAHEKGFPEFDDSELLDYATKNRIGNLRSAYNDMMFDKISDLKKDQALAAIKKSKGAATVTNSSSTAKTVGFSLKDIESMDNDTFVKNYDQIMEQFKKK